MKRRRLRLCIEGTVQGVGFRPFVYRQAVKHHLNGWVRNDADGVVVEIEGDAEVFPGFRHHLEHDLPARAVINGIHQQEIPALGEHGFVIHASSSSGSAVVLLPDTALCPACSAELCDPSDRRFRYPFITCNDCGPRFSMLTSAPFDRQRTGMRHFPMCAACRDEYRNPENRRFHAQTISCPECGPHLFFIDTNGDHVADTNDAAMALAVQALLAGRIMAVKGIGGVHLMCLADDAEAIERLRQRKRRPEKPFAVMFPDIPSLKACCRVSAHEEKLLTGVIHPIVLVRRHSGDAMPENMVSGNIAPNNSWIGAMLPYSPLHLMLLQTTERPLVATSGNASGEPVCFRNAETLDRLRGIADVFLLHNRPITRPLEDPVVRMAANRPLWLRLGRGTTPLTISSSRPLQDVIGMGGHMKAAFAVGKNETIHAGAYLGDLESLRSIRRYRVMAREWATLFSSKPQKVACDLHPDWVATREAKKSGLPVHTVQHHHAHILAVMAEHHLRGPVLGVAWDGTGWGTDGTIWGGEFLQVEYTQCRRIASLLSFPMPGGETAIRHPSRLALGALYTALGEDAFQRPVHDILEMSRKDMAMIRHMLERRIHCTMTSSAGRLFDVVSALLGLCHEATFEGQAAMRLEDAAGEGRAPDGDAYPFGLPSSMRPGAFQSGEMIRIDWRPMLRMIVEDVLAGRPHCEIASKFHTTMSRIVLAVADEVANATGLNDVALGGGCFQNARLLTETVEGLKRKGFSVFWPEKLPPNDGALAVGQVVAG